jgi:hypothetical protein
MLRINNRGFKKIYVYGGSGIFDTVARAATRLFTSDAAKRIATQVAQKAAVEAGKKLAEKIVAPKKTTLTPKSLAVLNKHLTPSTERLAPIPRDILKKYTTLKEELNLNALIDGSGVIRIEDYVRNLRT